MDRHMGKVKRFISAVRRKMSVRAVIMLLLFSVLLAPAVLAANEVVAVLFPAQLRFNGETKAAGQGGQAVLNYDNRVYVPLRFVAKAWVPTCITPKGAARFPSSIRRCIRPSRKWSMSTVSSNLCWRSARPSGTIFRKKRCEFGHRLHIREIKKLSLRIRRR